MKAIAEVRDWLAFAFGLVGVLLAWLGCPRDRGRKDVTIEPPPAVFKLNGPMPAILRLGPATGRASTNLDLSAGFSAD